MKMKIYKLIKKKKEKKKFDAIIITLHFSWAKN